jgi:Spy/CpxP family protein refolding chaperone
MGRALSVSTPLGKTCNRAATPFVLHTDWPDWGVILSCVRLRLYYNSRTMEKSEMKSVSSKKFIGAITLVGAILLAGVIAFAQQGQGQGGQERAGREWHGRGGKGGRHGGGMRGGFGGHFAEKLNLTDAQKAQMEQIAARYRESFKAKRGEGRREGFGFDAFNGGTFNEAAVRAAAQARANARVEMEVTRARMMSEMYNVLTAEQKAQLASERQQREQKRQERRANRQGNSGQN